MKPNVITDCNNCSHKEVCCMRFSLQNALDKINTFEWQYSEKISEILGDFPVIDKMEISIRCPYYMESLALAQGTIACSDSSIRPGKSE